MVMTGLNQMFASLAEMAVVSEQQCVGETPGFRVHLLWASSQVKHLMAAMEFHIMMPPL